MIGTGLPCGIMLCLVRGFGALAITQPSAMEPALSPRRASAFRGAGVFYALVPGLGYFAADHAGRGKLFLLATLAAGLSGLVSTIAALTLLFKGGVRPCRCCQGARRSSSFRSSSLGSRPWTSCRSSSPSTRH